MSEQSKRVESDRLAANIAYSKAVTFEPDATGRRLYSSYMYPAQFLGIQPHEYTGYDDECKSWHESCYIHSKLIVPLTKVTGKYEDCITLFKSIYVNGFEKFSIGACKQAVQCDDNGYILMCGPLLRMGENEFWTSCLSPALDYYVNKSPLDIKIENINRFVFQLGGPRSLEILEAASGDDLHDIKFLHHRFSTIAGRNVLILRLGMAGSLAYEVWPEMDEAEDVYEKILEAGQKYGLRRLGTPAYDATHWECGFPQSYMDFPVPIYNVEGLGDFYRNLHMGGTVGDGTGEDGYGNCRFLGSIGNDIKKFYRNPVEMGWSKLIKFDHDFMGRKALEKLVAEPKRKMVTLIWNPDDIATVFKSKFTDEVPYKDISYPEDQCRPEYYSAPCYWADKVVDAENREIGITTGRMYSPWYHNMLSIASMDVEYCVEGKEVFVVWGDEGDRQINIRATIARWPYLNQNRNEDVDVSLIKHGSMT